MARFPEHLIYRGSMITARPAEATPTLTPPLTRVVPFCDLTCPTQANPGGNLSIICECGGRRRHLEMRFAIRCGTCSLHTPDCTCPAYESPSAHR